MNPNAHHQVAVAGASGRMGHMLIEAIVASGVTINSHARYGGAVWAIPLYAGLMAAELFVLHRRQRRIDRRDFLASLGMGLGSLLTAVAVTTVGSVGFIGLIVPHLVRLAIGNDQRLLLPAATLAGGVLLCAADTAARTVVAPIQLPVGVLTALIGVPVFLFLLARHPR